MSLKSNKNKIYKIIDLFLQPMHTQNVVSSIYKKRLGLISIIRMPRQAKAGRTVEKGGPGKIKSLRKEISVTNHNNATN
jgi:hypothetical protein